MSQFTFKIKYPARNNKYYEGLLKRKAPLIYKQWQSKKFSSLRQALVAAKIKHETTGLDLLIRGWAKATDDEKLKFRIYVDRENLAERAANIDITSLLADLDMTEDE